MKYGLMLFLFLSTGLSAQVNPDLPNQGQLTKAYLEEISKREIGQTQFAVKSMSYPRAQSSAGGARTNQQQESSARDIQESDVYKLGKKGKKELFLLNRYRGFQVVSFAEGLESPKLVGRFPVYNNWSSEMYYLEKEDRVLVVNTEWTYSTNYWQTNYNTKLYLLDVSRSEEPKIIEELSIPGYLQESRMVGDVLYTITNNGNWSEMKAQITSVKLKGNTFETVDTEELHGENRWVRTMNVLKEGDKYLVVSTLSDWRNQGDYVNVHDITSAEGKIEKLFTAKARGQITERSQTFFHKNHLFAVSNYQASANERMRVSVEAFPVAKSTAIVESKENMRISVGDTNGQHASLQDVRVSGDLLYTFWVPANNIDPFDLFDISEPAKGLKHLGQLQFDGWISKAFPIEFNNKKYVLGLGWIVPATAENGRRYPQAKLFEIKKVNNVYKHEVAASLTLDSEEIWASLNDQDKFFEVLEEKPGVFNILFPVTFSKSWKSGAKIVNADLNINTLSEGASVVGDQGWLSRVFVNREVRAINTFSDTSLETFSQDDIMTGGMAKTVSVLELARNIIDFHVMNATEGFQIINQDKSVQVRHVNLSAVDAERNEALGELTVKGTYQWHKIKNNKLFVITSTNKVLPRSTETPYYWQQETFDFASFHVVDLSNGKVVSEKINLLREESEERYYYFNLKDSGDVFTIGKQIFKLTGDTLEELNVTADCQYFFNSDNREFSIATVGNDLFAFNTFSVKASDAPEARYSTTFSMPFMKKLLISDKSVSCSASVNVPGKPVMIKNDLLVTTDTTSTYFFPRGINYSYGSMGGRYYGASSKTFSLKFNNEKQAEMVDILNKDITSGLFQDVFVTFTAAEARVDLWSVNTSGEFVSKPQYLEKTDSDSSLITVKTLVGKNILFIKNDDKVDLYELSANKRLSKMNVSSEFDLNKDDGSAEFIFAIEDITASPDLSKIFISQGYYGMTEILLK